MTSGKTPVAEGSSVPRCPTLRVPAKRRILLTTSCEVQPRGLSTIITPSKLARSTTFKLTERRRCRLIGMRYAIRVLLRGRGVTVIAVLALALGIGANTAMFSVVNAVLLRPLPYREPDRLMTLLGGTTENPVSPADFLDVRKQAHSFEKMGAAEAWGASLTGRDAPEQISGLHLSEDMFPLLGVAPIRGRTFDANDFQPGKDQVAVIGYALWQRSFGGSDSVIGQKILLDGENYTVIGVMPADFYFAPFWVTSAEIWAPLNLLEAFSGPAPQTTKRDRYSL